MKKLFNAFLGAVAISLLPSVSHAFCTAIGGVPGVFLQSGAVATNIGVRTNRIGDMVNFTSTDQKIITMALTAASTHTTVQVNGDAPTCGSVNAQGYIDGGKIVSVLVNPN